MSSKGKNVGHFLPGSCKGSLGWAITPCAVLGGGGGGRLWQASAWLSANFITLSCLEAGWLGWRKLTMGIFMVKAKQRTGRKRSAGRIQTRDSPENVLKELHWLLFGFGAGYNLQSRNQFGSRLSKGSLLPHVADAVCETASRRGCSLGIAWGKESSVKRPERCRASGRVRPGCQWNTTTTNVHERELCRQPCNITPGFNLIFPFVV